MAYRHPPKSDTIEASNPNQGTRNRRSIGRRRAAHPAWMDSGERNAMDKNDKHHNKKSEAKRQDSQKPKPNAAQAVTSESGATLKKGGKVKKTY